MFNDKRRLHKIMAMFIIIGMVIIFILCSGCSKETAVGTTDVADENKMTQQIEDMPTGENTGGNLTYPAIEQGNQTSAIQSTQSVTPETSAKKVTGIEIDKANISLELMETEKLEATVFPQNAEDKTVRYTSLNRQIAAVDNVTGVITAKGEGATVIKATSNDGEFVKECMVTVSLPKTGKSPYFLYLEKGSFTITVYGKNADGTYNYTTPIRQDKTAIGVNDLTPAGVFSLTTAERWHVWSTGSAAQYAYKYTTNPDRFIHSPLYDTTDIRTMYNEYYNWTRSNDKGIGTTTTGGCLLMTTEASLWIYENCPSGTILYIVNGSPKGTTSKNPPSIVVRNQDPTDPLLK